MPPLLLILALYLGLQLPLPATDVLTYRYNQYGNGANTNEKSLNLDTVNPWDFGLKFTVPVPGQVYAQPLYKAGLGGKNLAFVATEHNVVLAIDTDRGTVVWSNALTDYGTPVPNEEIGSWDLVPEIGITSTPACDGSALFVLSKSRTPSTNGNVLYSQTVYKIDLATGRTLVKNRFGLTLAHTDSNGIPDGDFTYPDNDPYVVGTGDGCIQTNGQNRVYFNALRQMNRAALTLSGGVVYAGFASHGDIGPYHGWIIGFDAKTLALQTVFNTTPNGGWGGIWQSGGRLPSDNQGNLYFETGNGTFYGDLDSKGFPKDASYGDCFVKVTPDKNPSLAKTNPNGWGLKVTDYFTPTNNDQINWDDLDLGSCGPMVVPLKGKTVLIGTGKDGSLYSMNTAAMGKFDPATNRCLQTINQAFVRQWDPGNRWTSFFTPTYLNGKIYAFSSLDFGKQFTLSTNGMIGSWYVDGNGLVQTDVESDNTYALDWPGANTTISANGTNGVILWAIDRNASVLRAYRASDLLQIWHSDQVPADNFSGAIKFSVPVVADGKVFVGTEGALQIFGLTPAERH